MSECERCKKDIITYDSSRWDQTGIELPFEEYGGKTIKLCWDCYNKLTKNSEEE
jgi:hypothetical protein